MTQHPEQQPNPYGEYKGYSQQRPTGYSSDEMPQSAYPHQMADGPSSQSSSGQQYEQQYYRQQQQQQQQQYYQPPFSQQHRNLSSSELTSMGLNARIVALLAYLFQWISGLIILLLEKENRFVRFHAAQSIILFAGLGVLQLVTGILPFTGFLSGILGIAQLVFWILMMVNAYKGRYYKIPVIGDYAEKLAERFR